MADVVRCSQCEAPAYYSFGNGPPLCIDHYYTLMKANYLQVTMLASQLNYVRANLEAGSEGLVQFPRINLPPPRFMEGNVTFNNFDVNDSVIGVLNTGTITRLSNLDAAFEIIKQEGNEDLAKRLGDFTEAVINSQEMSSAVKDEISQQLEYIVSQLTTDKSRRATGVIKPLLSRIRESIGTIASLVTIWNLVEPLLRAQFGI